jgi:hypothetical protein
MKLDPLPSFLQPRLRLFLSVDLVGSTSFKQSGSLFPLQAPAEDQPFSELGAKWFSQIATFYRDVELHFSRSWEKCREAYFGSTQRHLSTAPELWKSNGDELIYTVDIKESEHVFYCLAAWLDAIKNYRSKLRQDSPTLDVKSAAWTAGFPLGNVEVIFCADVGKRSDELGDEDPKIRHFSLLEKWYEDESQRKGLIKDYIGPSIDTGFRIAALATPRKLMVSVEVALIIASVTPNDSFCETFGIKKGRLEIGYDGKQSLKGVIGGKPYPLFWIDVLHDDKLVEAEDGLVSPTKPSSDNIQKYCQAFFQDNKKYLLRPFIYQCKDSNFSTLPENYAPNVEKLSQKWVKERDRLKVRLRSILEENTPVPGSEVTPDTEAINSVVSDLGSSG